MGRRGISGTVAAYVPCGTCTHALIHHEDRGQGRCTSLVRSVSVETSGRALPSVHRCTCPRHTTDERII